MNEWMKSCFPRLLQFSSSAWYMGGLWAPWEDMTPSQGIIWLPIIGYHPKFILLFKELFLSLHLSLSLWLCFCLISDSLSVSQPPRGFSAFSILKPCVPVVTEVEIMQLHHESPFLQQTTNGLLGARTVREKAAQRDLSCCLSVSSWKPQLRLWHLGVFLKVFCKPVSNTIFGVGLKAK